MSKNDKFIINFKSQNAIIFTSKIMTREKALEEIKSLANFLNDELSLTYGIINKDDNPTMFPKNVLSTCYFEVQKV